MTSLPTSGSEVAGRAGGCSGYLVNNHTLILGLKDILPEDILWRQKQPKTPAMICLENDQGCDCPWQCIPTLARRSYDLFVKLRHVVQIFVLFQRGEKPLVRNPPTRSVQHAAGVRDVETVIPRYWALYITHAPDYTVRIMRVNYDSLNLLLETADMVPLPDLVTPHR